jgi:hypothetical protein
MSYYSLTLQAINDKLLIKKITHSKVKRHEQELLSYKDDTYIVQAFSFLKFFVKNECMETGFDVEDTEFGYICKYQGKIVEEYIIEEIE